MTTADELERLQRLERIVSRAKETGNTAALNEAFSLLRRIIDAQHPERSQDGVSEVRPDLMTRARTREEGPLDPVNAGRRAEGLNKLKQGRDQCTAAARNGDQCRAPAIQGGLVCRRHGGGAPQVKIKAEYTENLTAAYGAWQDFQEAKGTSGELDALVKALDTDRAVEAYQIKMRLAKMMRDELRKGKTGSRTP